MSAVNRSSRVDLATLRASCSGCSLQQLCLPAGVAQSDLEELERIVKRGRPLRSGELLFRMSQPFQCLFVVRSGSVKTYYQGTEGDDQIIGFHLPGELLGLDALDSDAHSCTAEALEHSSVCEVPYSQLEDIAARVPGLRRQLMRIVSREMTKDHGQLVMLGRRSAQARLAIFLMSLSKRLAERGYSAYEFNLSMSRYDLANYLGLAVETVSRLFSRFQDDGLIRVDRKHVEILDADGLQGLEHDSSERRV